jgi:hypothetical protein
LVWDFFLAGEIGWVLGLFVGEAGLCFFLLWFMAYALWVLLIACCACRCNSVGFFYAIVDSVNVEVKFWMERRLGVPATFTFLVVQKLIVSLLS